MIHRMLHPADPGRGDRQVIDLFGEPDPALLRLPHVFTELGPRFREAFEQVVRVPAGIWGEPASAIQEDVDRIPDLGDRLSAGFRAWNRPPGQDWVKRRLDRGWSQSFKLVIPAATTDDVLRRMDELVDQDEAPLDGLHHPFLAALTAWVENLGWALTELGPEECSIALFVASTDRRRLVDELQQRLGVAGLPAWRPTRAGDHWDWPGPWTVDLSPEAMALLAWQSKWRSPEALSPAWAASIGAATRTPGVAASCGACGGRLNVGGMPLASGWGHELHVNCVGCGRSEVLVGTLADPG